MCQTRSEWEARSTSVARSVQATQDALSRVREMFSRLDGMERWLGELAPRLPAEHECTIEDAAQLYRVKGRFQALKDLCDERTTTLCELNEAGTLLTLCDYKDLSIRLDMILWNWLKCD